MTPLLPEPFDATLTAALACAADSLALAADIRRSLKALSALARSSSPYSLWRTV